MTGMLGYCTVFRKSAGFDRRLFPGRHLRAKVGPGVQSRVYTCSQLWRSARTNRQNFTVCRCRPKWPARSSLTGLRQRLSAAQRNPSSIRLVPWPPRFPGPLGHPPRPSPSLVQVWRHFATFFLARWGVPAPKGQNKGFPRSGRIRGGMGPERCGSGAPNRPFEWPHSRFGRARYFFSDPPFGLWGLFENPIGQNLGQ